MLGVGNQPAKGKAKENESKGGRKGTAEICERKANALPISIRLLAAAAQGVASQERYKPTLQGFLL